MKLQAVVFDFDGVILDTEMARFEAMQKIYASFGQVLPLDMWLKSIGRASYAVHPFDYLQEILGEPLDCEKLHEEHKKIEIEMANALPVLPGVIDRIEEVLASGGKVAVASSSSRNWVTGHLRRRNLINYFSAIVCREDTVAHKPDPEPYVTALKRLECSAQNSFAVEDSPLGIEAATNAGITCIAIACSLTRHMDLGKAHFKFDSLAEICFTDLCKIA